MFCIQITFNNPLKVCFSSMKYPITIQPRLTQILKVYFLLKNQFLTDFLILLVHKIYYILPFVQISLQ